MPADEQREPSARPEQARVFFALWPPEALARQLATSAADFAQTAGGRPTRRETIHLTLAFLGNVPLARLAELEQVAHGVRGAAFDLVLDRFGFWSHKRLLWAGCSQPPEALDDLAEKLAAALSGGGFLEPAMQPRFTPHITLVRKLGQSAPLLPACVPLHWPCTSFVLVRSLLSVHGSSYQTLAEFPLDDGAPAGVRPAESGW